MQVVLFVACNRMIWDRNRSILPSGAVHMGLDVHISGKCVLTSPEYKFWRSAY